MRIVLVALGALTAAWAVVGCEGGPAGPEPALEPDVSLSQQGPAQAGGSGPKPEMTFFCTTSRPVKAGGRGQARGGAGGTESLYQYHLYRIG